MSDMKTPQVPSQAGADMGSNGSVSRRSLLGAAIMGAGAMTSRRAHAGSLEADPSQERIWLNNSAMNLLPRNASDAATTYLREKINLTFPPGFLVFDQLDPPRTAFSKIINADADEIALVQSTLMGENLIVNGMGLPHARGNIVTDSLHYDGSLYLYESIKNSDLEVRVVAPRGYGVDPRDLDAAIDGNTKLLALSHVSYVNGFAHDLDEICHIAHRKGVPVYADIVQSAGVVPIDVKRSGLDFAACGSYKWLMGDMGAGFLFCRKEHLGTLVKRTLYGYLQCTELEQHALEPMRSEGWPIQYTVGTTAGDFFEVGTPAIAALLTLEKTLPFILSIGVEAIASHIEPLVSRLRSELPKLGFASLTPAGNRSPATLFHIDDSDRAQKAFKAGRIVATIRKNQVRFSPGIHNTMDDIEGAIAVMRKL